MKAGNEIQVLDDVCVAYMYFLHCDISRDLFAWLPHNVLVFL